MKTLLRLLGRTVCTLLATVFVLVVFGLAISAAQGRVNTLLQQAFGWAGVVVTGMVGTPVHELGHYLVCRLFGMHVTDVKLFRPIAGQQDGILGYVSYSYDPQNSLQRLGCFFTGIAPMLTGILFILLLTRLLAPDAYRGTGDRLNGAMRKTKNPFKLFFAAASGYFHGLGQLRGLGILKGVLLLYLTVSISMHLSLSPADLQGAAAGFGLFLLLCAMYAALTMAFSVDIRKALTQTATKLSLFLSIGLCACGVFALVSELIVHLIS